VVAHGAVDAEDLPALAGVALLGVGVLLGRNGGAGAEGGDIGGDVGDLLVGELHLQVIGRLDARLGHRHTTGAHLEVHGGGADTGEARAETVDAHTVRAVAVGAVGGEELLAVLRVAGGRGGRLGRLRGDGRVGGT